MPYEGIILMFHLCLRSLICCFWKYISIFTKTIVISFFLILTTDPCMQENQLIKKVLEGDKRSQKTFYQRFAPKMYGVALRFARDKDEANDMLQEGFVKVFSKLQYYRGEGSLEGWIRRTIVNTAINIYKRNLKHLSSQDLDTVMIFEKNNEASPIEQMSARELLGQINQLPVGYRTVFNLYVVDGYSHKEIADLLDITENTSKSQLSRARAYLQKRIQRT